MRFGYDKHLSSYAKDLRKNCTLGEVLLWQQLKGKQRSGYRFHRQKPLHTFIVDFWCPRLSLAIEIDGSATHDTKIEADIARQRKLENLGVHFLRFTEKEVQTNLEGVVSAIDHWITNQAQTSPRDSQIMKDPRAHTPALTRHPS